jgi:cyclohexanone monooxygenase
VLTFPPGKRPCFHDEFLDTFNRDNVHLVVTGGTGVEKIDETGLWVEGVHYPLDVIVYATGFEFSTDFTYKSGLEVYGRGGRTLTDAWKNGMETYHGMHIHGFPNLFMMGMQQGSSLASNVTSNYVDLGLSLAAILKKKKELAAKVVDVPKDVQDKWLELLLSAGAGILGGPECTPGYYNSEGIVEGRREKLNSMNTARYPAGTAAYFEYIANWRTNGKFEGLEFDGAKVAA